MALVVCSTVQETQPDTAVSAQWVVARFEVGCTRYLDHHGTATLLPDFARDPAFA